MKKEKLLYTIPKERHSAAALKKILKRHPEVRFVSVVAADMSGHSTEEKIPLREFIDDIPAFLLHGVQTDGSSVFLPGIADLSNGRVDLIPDSDVNWYVDYNHDSPGLESEPCGTLCIPAFLRHNGTSDVGPRYMLREAEKTFRQQLPEILAEHPYALTSCGIKSPDEISGLELTGATELEFWVQTPEDKANREQLFISQELKEQYWKRTSGPVRTALEESIICLEHYGLGVEMGHKEVGGIIARLGASGHYDHIMEQLEIDWKYSGLIQASDNEYFVKNIVSDIFRKNGLDVTFMAKPVNGVAGSGEHHHIGVCAKLKKGGRKNLFDCIDGSAYLSPVGFGALMGLLKNYEAVNTFIACSNDAMNRLKPGFEAPVCIVTSLGKNIDTPSRNRTVLIGVIRDRANPLHTRFELRSPCAGNNSFLVFAASYLAMLDGIKAALTAGKTAGELEASISKKYGEEDFYLETGRVYRSERDVFTDFTAEERDRLFGKAPATVYETFEYAGNKQDFLTICPAFTSAALDSYKKAMIQQWVMELRDRIVPRAMKFASSCKPHHDAASSLDAQRWEKVKKLRDIFAVSTAQQKSVLEMITEALEDGRFEEASALQIQALNLQEQLEKAFNEYEKNII